MSSEAASPVAVTLVMRYEVVGRPFETHTAHRARLGFQSSFAEHGTNVIFFKIMMVPSDLAVSVGDEFGCFANRAELGVVVGAGSSAIAVAFGSQRLAQNLRHAANEVEGTQEDRWQILFNRITEADSPI